MPYSWETGEMKQPVLTGRRITSVFKDREGNYWVTRKIELDIQDLEDKQHMACGTLVTIKIPFA